MVWPRSARKTGKSIAGVGVLTSELCPNCRLSIVIEGTHERTREKGWFAYCKKSGKLEKFGPYETLAKSLRYMTLAQGCDTCEYNKSDKKDEYLSLLDEEVQRELAEIFGEEHTYSVITGPLTSFVENRRAIDLLFKHIFGTRLFKSIPDDSVAIKDFITPCLTEQNFILKITALAGVIDRIEETDVKKIIKTRETKDMRGSINILEQILKENVPDYRTYIIKNMRNIMALRSKFYPTHAHSSEIIKILNNLGINKYPLENWDKGWIKILTLCCASFQGLIIDLQSLL